MDSVRKAPGSQGRLMRENASLWYLPKLPTLLLKTSSMVIRFTARSGSPSGLCGKGCGHIALPEGEADNDDGIMTVRSEPCSPSLSSPHLHTHNIATVRLKLASNTFGICTRQEWTHRRGL